MFLVYSYMHFIYVCTCEVNLDIKHMQTILQNLEVCLFLTFYDYNPHSLQCKSEVQTFECGCKKTVKLINSI